MFKHGNREDQIPVSVLPIEHVERLQQFFDIRSICGSIENPVTPDIIRQWESHSYVTFQKWERDVILHCDRSLRHAHGEVLKYHANRKPIKLEDNDRAVLNGRRNSRL